MKDGLDRNRIKDMEINLSTNQRYNYSDDTFEVLINHEISNNHFVFIKDDKSFKANTLTTIQVYDLNNDSIIIQDSWRDDILKSSYESTRLSTEYLSFTKSISLLNGMYNIRVNIQDLDNSNIFKSEKKIDLSSIDGFGELAIYIYNDLDEINLIKEINNELKINNNNIQLSFQYFQEKEEIDELIVELDDSNEEHLEEFFNLSMDDNGFYSIDYVIPNNYYNHFDLTLSISEYSVTKTFYLEDEDNDFWTNDINEIESVMRYILPISDIKALKKMELNQKLEFIADYWSDKDPNPDTLENELLLEFRDRVKFVNIKFSDLNRGWRSDRGRIYIIYGPPQMVERYSNQSDGLYEIWEFPSGLKFIFLDRNGFGNFILIRQTI
jgi:GWxTD domain-containing protein